MSYYDDYPYYAYMPAMAPYMMQQQPGMPSPDPFSYPQNLPAALQLIQGALEGETEDRMFYGYLINAAPTQEEKEIITGIRNDEIKHFGLFRQLYFELTGRTPPPPQETAFTPPPTYCAGLKKALLGEQGAVQKYRRILFALQNRRQINVLTEIITDEIRHGILYNYLYSKNECNA